MIRRVAIHSTTVLAVRRDGRTVLAADGQITIGNTVMKGTAKKLRRLGDGRVVAGFAGSAADGLALFERLEAKLKEQGGGLARAAVELAKDWRTDRVLRRLEALLLVADRERLFMISGTGDLIEPDEGVAAIGSGGPYALAAARALLRHSTLGARELAEAALGVAGEICIYTNDQRTFEELA
ncbi:MAG: ATP-dependent protease subunit HslV [Myxococcales bacterium]|nr:ATP-dependent protease subunit HslV [Myxococcales bacterium]